MKTTKTLFTIFALLLLTATVEIKINGQTPQTNEEKLAVAEKLFKEAYTLFQQGTAESYQLATAKFKSAAELFVQVDEKPSQAISLVLIGLIADKLGDKTTALKNYEAALLIFRGLNDSDKDWETVTLNNIGTVYNVLGEKQKALDYFNQALSVFRQVSDKRGEALTINNIGEVYAELGEKQKALENYFQSLLLFRQVGNKSGEAITLNNIGGVYADIGENQKALDYYIQSLSIRRQLSDKRDEATTLNNIGNVYAGLSDNQKALEYFNQALLIRRQVGDKNGEAITLRSIGGVYSVLSENQKALEYFQLSLPLSKFVGNKEGQAVTLGWLRGCWNNQKNPHFAVFYGKQSVNLFQQLRSNIVGLDKEIQKTYLKTIETNYRALAEILIEQGRLAEAQQGLDLFKDQQFFDFNRTSNEPVKQLVQTPREVESSARYDKSSEQIGKIGQQIEELKRRIGTRQRTSDESAQLQKFESELKIATDGFLAVLKEFETEFSKPSDEKDKVGEVPNNREMKSALGNLNQQTRQKTVAVYTLVGEDKYHALIVSPDGIKAVSFLIKGVELNEKALKLWGLLQSDRYDTTVLSKQIYDAVFAPIEKELPKDTTTIMWSLDGNLRYLPMAALFDGKRFLAERFNHVNFTRADSERLTRNVNPNWTGTGFGTSNAQTVELLGDKISFNALPGVTAELAEIFKQTDSKTGILAGEVLPDKQFTKESFLAAMKRKRPLVHIASHFSFRPGDEARSFLLLGDGTALTLNEMKAETNLFAGVDLLTLSACNTAAAQADANGREIDGFAELAQRLGAGAVMATLWSVSDASTPWLMRDFYATRQSQTGMNKAEALRKAQIALLGGTAKIELLPNAEKGANTNKVKIVIVPKGGKRDGNDATRSDIVYLDEAEAPLYKKDDKKPFAHPYYWSPFILFGNWK